MRLLLAVLLLAGCSHVSVDASSNASPAATTTGAQAGVSVRSSGSVAAVVIAGMFIASAVEDARNPRPFPSFSEFSDWFRGTPKAELDPDRKVSEQDCTRPLDYSLGNIRCK